MFILLWSSCSCKNNPLVIIILLLKKRELTGGAIWLYHTTMKEDTIPVNRDILSLLSELSQVVRFCRQDAVFCEAVTFSQFLILDCLSERGKISMSELRQMLAVDKSTVTRLVEPLVRQRMVKKSKSEQDSRAVTLQLTCAGEDTLRKVWRCLQGFVDAVTAGIQVERKEQVYEAVKIFIRAVKNASSACPCCDAVSEEGLI
jgi:DNA-binding MarR family transcriptional regulator